MENSEETSNGRYRPGYDWYPDQWKQSDTFLDVDDPLIRYYYREVTDILYVEGGYWEANKARFEKAQRVKISAEQWAQVEALFEVVEKSPRRLLWTHAAVLKRIDRRAFTSAKNGAKGGRPEGSKKPNENLKNNQTENLNKPKKPISTIEQKGKEKINHSVGSDLSLNGSRDKPASLPPLRAALASAGKDQVAEICKRYAKKLEAYLEAAPPRDKMIAALAFFWPVEISKPDQEKLAALVADFNEVDLEMILNDLQQNLEAIKAGALTNILEFVNPDA